MNVNEAVTCFSLEWKLLGIYTEEVNNRFQVKKRITNKKPLCSIIIGW